MTAPTPWSTGSSRRSTPATPTRSTAVRHCFTTDDIALVIVDWVVGDLAGTATDVLRRTNGEWRYLIDNPHGTA